MFYMPYIWSKFLLSLCGNIILLIVICLLLYGNTSIDYAVIIFNESREWSHGGIVDILAIPISNTTIISND